LSIKAGCPYLPFPLVYQLSQWLYLLLLWQHKIPPGSLQISRSRNLGASSPGLIRHALWKPTGRGVAAHIPLFSTGQEATSHLAGSAFLPRQLATHRASVLLADSASSETAPLPPSPPWMPPSVLASIACQHLSLHLVNPARPHLPASARVSSLSAPLTDPCRSWGRRSEAAQDSRRDGDGETGSLCDHASTAPRLSRPRDARPFCSPTRPVASCRRGQ